MNPTGIKPVEFKVLIRVDEVEETSSGGLFIPRTALEREQMAHDRGVLVEVSDMAFQGWDCNIPKPGDKIIFSKYAGTVIQFRDGRNVGKYRLCNDKDICAIIKE